MSMRTNMLTQVILVIVMVLVVADLFASTIYYNYIDNGMTTLAHRFENGDLGSMSCGERPVVNENGDLGSADCTGGILAERDAYLRNTPVLIEGSWGTNPGGWGPETFRMYFRYWF